MIRMKPARNGAGVLGFGKIRFTKNDGERGRSYSAAAQNADESARINAARKEHADWNVAHQLQPDDILQRLTQVRNGTVPIVG